jgi:hypothetical protein
MAKKRESVAYGGKWRSMKLEESGMKTACGKSSS